MTPALVGGYHVAFVIGAAFDAVAALLSAQLLRAPGGARAPKRDGTTEHSGCGSELALAEC
jgi:hypothetical protein